MKICVLIKQVPDKDSKIVINADYISKSAQEKLKKIGATINLPRKI